MAQKQKPAVSKPKASTNAPAIRKRHERPVIEDELSDTINDALENAKEKSGGCGCGGSIW